MPLSLDTRLALLGLPQDEVTPDLAAIVADWSRRAEALTAHAKAALDPFETPLLARVSPFGVVRPEAGAGFSLGGNCPVAAPDRTSGGAPDCGEIPR